MSRPRLVRELLQEQDFIARLADAWDGRGENVLRAGGEEHRALLQIARLPIGLAGASWSQLHGEERYKLLIAARQVIEFGRTCACIFGEGEGARF